jgi:hypothetical protein
MNTSIVLVTLLALPTAGGNASQRLEGDDAYAEGNRLYYIERDFDGALDAYLRVPPESPDYAWAQRYIG